MEQNDLTSKLQRLSEGLNMLKGEQKGLVFNLRSVSKLNRLKNMINKVDFLTSNTTQPTRNFKRLTSLNIESDNRKWSKNTLNFNTYSNDMLNMTKTNLTSCIVSIFNPKFYGKK